MFITLKPTLGQYDKTKIQYQQKLTSYFCNDNHRMAHLLPGVTQNSTVTAINVSYLFSIINKKK